MISPLVHGSSPIGGANSDLISQIGVNLGFKSVANFSPKMVSFPIWKPFPNFANFVFKFLIQRLLRVFVFSNNIF